MANDAMSAAERRWLEEPEDHELCERCWTRVYDNYPLCWRCEEDDHEAELAATEGNEEPRS